MIIVELQGGLGNQMFQYAAGRALAARRGTALRLDLTHYDGEQRVAELSQFRRRYQLDDLKINASPAGAEEIRAVRDRWRSNRLVAAATLRFSRLFPTWCTGYYPEPSLEFDPGFASLPDQVYLRGFWQSPRYFDTSADLIRQEFCLRDSAYGSYAAEFIAARRRSGVPVVSVHVRRGDLAYVAEKVKKPGIVAGEPVTVDYIRAAMARFAEAPTFIVFSDSEADLDWCREHIRADDTHFSSGHSDLQDFALMQSCDHNIIANSSFSWWAAWLNPNPAKRVVAPRRWFSESFAPGFRIESLIPSEWELL